MSRQTKCDVLHIAIHLLLAWDINIITNLECRFLYGMNFVFHLSLVGSNPCAFSFSYKHRRGILCVSVSLAHTLSSWSHVVLETHVLDSGIRLCNGCYTYVLRVHFRISCVLLCFFVSQHVCPIDVFGWNEGNYFVCGCYTFVLCVHLRICCALVFPLMVNMSLSA